MTTVPEPMSAGLMMISSRRMRRFKARLSRLVKLSRILVGLALSNCQRGLSTSLFLGQIPAWETSKQELSTSSLSLPLLHDYPFYFASQSTINPVVRRYHSKNNQFFNQQSTSTSCLKPE